MSKSDEFEYLLLYQTIKSQTRVVQRLPLILVEFRQYDRLNKKYAEKSNGVRQYERL